MGFGHERALAAAAHLAVLLALPGLLIAAALYGYGQAQRASFLIDQAGQATAYQAAVGAALLVLGGTGLEAALGGTLLSVVHLGAMAYGAFGAFSALDGRRFRYLRR